MRKGVSLACVLLGWLAITLLPGDAPGAEAPDAFFTCEDLIGLTYRVWLLNQGFVCFDFISMDMVIETYATKGSFTVGYGIKGESPGVCSILADVTFPPGVLYARIHREGLVGVGYVIFERGAIPFPVIGYGVQPEACQPGP